MPWRKRTVYLALVISSLVHAQSNMQGNKCPAYHEKSPLAFASVYNGLPEHGTEIVADEIKGSLENLYASTDVSSLADTGNDLYLVCVYGNVKSKDTVIVKLEKRVKHCIYRTYPENHPAEMVCK